LTLTCYRVQIIEQKMENMAASLADTLDPPYAR